MAGEPGTPDDIGLANLGAGLKLANASASELAASFATIIKNTDGLVDVRMAELKTSISEAGAEVQKLNTQYQSTNVNLKEQLGIQEDLIGAKNRELEAQIALVQAYMEEGEAKEELLKQLGEESKQLRLRGRYYNQIDQSTQDIAGNLGLAYKWENSSLKALTKSLKPLKNADGATIAIGSGWGRIWTNLQGLLHPMEVLYTIGLKIVESTIAYNKELMEANKTLNQATAMAAKFEGHINATWLSFSKYGASAADAAGNQATLVEGFAKFTQLGPKMQKHLLGLSGEFNALGMSTEDMAGALNFTTKVMGLQAKPAADFTKNLVMYGKQIGKTPKTFLKEFVTAMPKLVMYGSRMEEVFYKLQKRSKATGISFDDLLGITEELSEFDNVTKMVAGLSAAFGKINLDPMQLMMLGGDPDAQLQVIREALLETGQSIGDLDWATQKMIAKTIPGMGGDVGKLLKFMNGEWKAQTEETASWEETLKDSSSAMDKLNTIMKSLAKSFEEPIKKLNHWLDSIMQSEEQMHNWALGVTAASLVAVAGITKIVNAWIAAKFAAAAAAAASVAAGGTIATSTTVAAGKVGIFATIGAAIGKAWWMLVTIIEGVAFIAGVSVGALVATIAGIGLAIVGVIVYWDEAVELFTWGIGEMSDKFEAFRYLLLGDWDKLGNWWGNFVDMGFGEDKGQPGKFSRRHDGITNDPGGMAILKTDEVMTNVPGGSNILTKGNSQTIETLLRDLTSAVNNLSSGGGSGKPLQVNLVVDGKTLATSVFNNSSYFSMAG
tara:strand:+ start:665 stop:3001 length:2337 start_codon:yes stop_codon:yes gene_type:complete